jgi:hypothetical protein
MFAEDLTIFFADFAVAATLASASVSAGAIVDAQSVVEVDGVVTQAPTALLRSSDAVSAAPNQTFVADSVTYRVRQVLREPPDGALTRLVLVRV